MGLGLFETRRVERRRLKSVERDPPGAPPSGSVGDDWKVAGGIGQRFNSQYCPLFWWRMASRTQLGWWGASTLRPGIVRQRSPIGQQDSSPATGRDMNPWLNDPIMSKEIEQENRTRRIRGPASCKWFSRIDRTRRSPANHTRREYKSINPTTRCCNRRSHHSAQPSVKLSTTTRSSAPERSHHRPAAPTELTAISPPRAFQKPCAAQGNVMNATLCPSLAPSFSSTVFERYSDLANRGPGMMVRGCWCPQPSTGRR